MIHRLIGYDARLSRQWPDIRFWPNPAVEPSISVYQLEKVAHCHQRQQTTQSSGMPPEGTLAPNWRFHKAGSQNAAGTGIDGEVNRPTVHSNRSATRRLNRLPCKTRPLYACRKYVVSARWPQRLFRLPVCHRADDRLRRGATVVFPLPGLA